MKRTERNSDIHVTAEIWVSHRKGTKSTDTVLFTAIETSSSGVKADQNLADALNEKVRLMNPEAEFMVQPTVDGNIEIIYDIDRTALIVQAKNHAQMIALAMSIHLDREVKITISESLGPTQTVGA